MFHFKIHENLQYHCFDIGQDTIIYLWSKCLDNVFNNNLKLFKEKKDYF